MIDLDKFKGLCQGDMIRYVNLTTRGIGMPIGSERIIAEYYYLVLREPWEQHFSVTVSKWYVPVIDTKSLEKTTLTFNADLIMHGEILP